jgi:hypothetical protein
MTRAELNELRELVTATKPSTWRVGDPIYDWQMIIIAMRHIEELVQTATIFHKILWEGMSSGWLDLSTKAKREPVLSIEICQVSITKEERDFIDRLIADIPLD